ncbi:MAG: hypothetical protein ACE5I5_15970 [Candidatus Heimdallarchaeota archaeon]
MNWKVSLHLGKIFALASVREKRAKGSVPTGAAKSPRVNIMFFGIGFPLVTILTYLFGDTFLKGVSAMTFFVQIAIFLPSFTTLAAIIFGILSELQSTSVGSTDMINWLPIRASEYVFASAIALTYFLTPMLALFFAITFGLAISLNMMRIGLLSVSLSLLGILLGVFIAEIFRALLNRVSATLYKRSGRSAVVGRMIVGILMLVVFMLIFNVNVMLIILQHLGDRVEGAWFIPILWPTLAIMSYLTRDTIQTLSYTLLSGGFTLGLLWASVKLREKYWEPLQVAIQLMPLKLYTPKRGILGKFGFTTAETALIRKDFRSVTRRREMIGWIAIPIAISIPFIITYSSWTMVTTTPEKLAFFAGPLFGVIMLAFYLTLTSIGQEGSAFLNLLAAPMSEKEITKAKLTSALFPATCALAGLLAFGQLLLQFPVEILLLISGTSFIVVCEAALVGLVMGSRFPNFTEVPKTKFVTSKGILLGILTLIGSIGVTIFPMLLYFLVKIPVPVIFTLGGVTLLIMAIASIISYLSIQAIKHNLQELIISPL